MTLPRVSVLFAALALAACAHQSEPLPDNAKACPEERPQMCTMDYRPVTGLGKNGEDLGEFGNACNACSQEGVTHTVPAKPDQPR